MWEHRTVGAREDDNDTEATLVRYSYSNHLQSAALELDQYCTQPGRSVSLRPFYYIRKMGILGNFDTPVTAPRIAA